MTLNLTSGTAAGLTTIAAARSLSVEEYINAAARKRSSFRLPDVEENEVSRTSGRTCDRFVSPVLRDERQATKNDGLSHRTSAEVRDRDVKYSADLHPEFEKRL